MASGTILGVEEPIILVGTWDTKWDTSAEEGKKEDLTSKALQSHVRGEFGHSLIFCYIAAAMLPIKL